MGGPARDNYVALSEDDLDSLRHMLGVRHDKPSYTWAYRNYFAAGASQIPSMERLRSAGLVVRGQNVGEAQLYHATERGGDVAGLNAEQIRGMCVSPSADMDQ